MMTKSGHQLSDKDGGGGCGGGDGCGGGGGGDDDDDDDNYTSKLQGKWKPNNETWGRI